MSEADLKSNKEIRNEIEKNFPEYTILSEEDKESWKNIDNEFLCIFDPLDGTNNFIHGIPIFATSLAFVHNGEVIAAATYLPMQDELFCASKTQGAYCCINYNMEKREISVSETPLKKAIVSIDSNHYKPTKEAHAKIRKALYGSNIFRIKILNAAAIELAYVADARIDACVYQGDNIWDLAAGALLIQEAGGKVTDFKGMPWNIKSDSIIASNGKIHSELEKMVAKQFKKDI